MQGGSVLRETKIESGWRFLRSLPVDCEGEERVRVFHELLTESNHEEWARETARAVYHLAGSGAWKIESLYDLNMISTAAALNPALLPLIADDVERVFVQIGVGNRQIRATWDYVLSRVANATSKCA
jgi:hypothetical protein